MFCISIIVIIVNFTNGDKECVILHINITKRLIECQMTSDHLSFKKNKIKDKQEKMRIGNDNDKPGK